MSNLQDSDVPSYLIEVVNTYPTPVTYILYVRSSSGAPTPMPLASIGSNAMQQSGNGSIDHIVVNYASPQGPQTVTIQYGEPINYGRQLNALWNTSPTEQIVVIVETSMGGD